MVEVKRSFRLCFPLKGQGFNPSPSADIDSLSKLLFLTCQQCQLKKGIPGQQTSAKREMSPSWLLFCCDNTMKDNHAEVFCILDTIRLLHYTTQPFISYGSTTRKGKEGSTVKYFEKK